MDRLDKVFYEYFMKYFIRGYMKSCKLFTLHRLRFNNFTQIDEKC